MNTLTEKLAKLDLLHAAAKRLRGDDRSTWLNQVEDQILAAQALEAWAWVASQSMPVEIVLKRWRILGRDSSGYLKFYYADTPLGCVLAAMEGEK